MKTAVIFYSWSGHTKQLAQARAAQEQAQLYAVEDRKRPGILKAYTAGCLSAMRAKRTPVKALDIPLDAFDHIIVMAPVWAGYLAPAVNSVFDALPPGKHVTVCAVSGSGASRCRERVGELVRARGCKFIGYEDIRG